MSDKLAVIVLGNRNSGKSYTWNFLFGETVRTGTKLKKLFFGQHEYVEVFLISGSPEERKLYVEDIIKVNDPRIILCSLQYRNDVMDSFNYFIDNGYLLFVHWLNPGHHDVGYNQDSLGLVPTILSKRSLFGIRNGKSNPQQRVSELRDFIYGWARMRGLISRDI